MGKKSVRVFVCVCLAAQTHMLKIAESWKYWGSKV